MGSVLLWLRSQTHTRGRQQGDWSGISRPEKAVRARGSHPPAQSECTMAEGSEQRTPASTVPPDACRRVSRVLPQAGRGLRTSLLKVNYSLGLEHLHRTHHLLLKAHKEPRATAATSHQPRGKLVECGLSPRGMTSRTKQKHRWLCLRPLAAGKCHWKLQTRRRWSSPAHFGTSKALGQAGWGVSPLL